MLLFTNVATYRTRYKRYNTTNKMTEIRQMALHQYDLSTFARRFLEVSTLYLSNAASPLTGRPANAVQPSATLSQGESHVQE
jgi:hypothetical protein